MTALDIATLVVLGFSIYGGAKKGLISQLVGIIAIILGAWASMMFNQPFSEWLSGYMTSVPAGTLKIISYIAIFVIVMILLTLLGVVITKVVKLVMLGWLNRLLGAAFSVILCCLALGIVAVLFDSLYAAWASAHEVSELPAFISESIFYAPIHNIGNWVFPYLGKLSI